MDYDISIKCGDFIDTSTLLARAPGPCFMCGRSTWCIDVNFAAYFCDSAACNHHIDEDLHRSYWHHILRGLNTVDLA